MRYKFILSHFRFWFINASIEHYDEECGSARLAYFLYFTFIGSSEGYNGVGKISTLSRGMSCKSENDEC